MKILKIIFISGISLVLIVVIAGYLKFNVTNNDIYVQQNDGSVVKYNDLHE